VVCLFLLPQNVFSQNDNAGQFYNDDGLYDEDETDLFEDDEGVTITGIDEKTQVSKTISRDEIERAHAVDIPSLLTNSLGLGASSYGAYGNDAWVNIRGFDLKRVAILVDGIPVNTAMDGEFDLNSIPQNAIEKIEVIYGGSDTKFNISGALGGVINIVTVSTKNKKPALSVDVSNTSFMPGQSDAVNGRDGSAHGEDLFDAQRVNARFAVGGERASLSLSGFFNRAGNHFLYEDYLGYTLRKVNNEVFDGGASAWLTNTLRDGTTKIIVKEEVYGANKNIPVGGMTTKYSVQKDFSARTGVLFNAPRAFSDSFEMEGSVTHNYTQKKFSASLHQQNNIQAIYRFVYYQSDLFTLRTGVDYRFDLIKSTELGVHTGNNGGIYFTTEFNFGDKYLIIPSIKFVTDGGSFIPVPKLGLSYNVNDDITIKNNYFRSFKFPVMEDLYWNDGMMTGNPNLKNEDGWGLDIGLVYRKKTVTLESTLFYQYTLDSIHWAPVGTTWKPSNVGKAVIMGSENKLNFDIKLKDKPVNKINISILYTFMPSYLLSYGFNFASNKRIPYMALHTAGINASLFWKSGDASLLTHFESDRFGDTNNLKSNKAFFTADINVNQKINSMFAMYFVIKNLFNARYEYFEDYTMPGVSLTVGIKLNFGQN
jgi:vitamin B12 transporter